MKKYNRTVLALVAGVLTLGLGAGQGLSANSENSTQSIQKNSTALTTDGSAVAEKTRITQAERQAAAKRSREKGFVAPTLENSKAPVDATQIEGGTKK